MKRIVVSALTGFVGLAILAGCTASRKPPDSPLATVAPEDAYSEKSTASMMPSTSSPAPSDLTSDREEDPPSEFFEEVVPFDAQLEILCANGKLVFSRIAATPQVRADRPPFDETCTRFYQDKHEIISELFRIANGKEAAEEHEFEVLPTLRLLLSGQSEEEPWHYLFEFGTDGFLRVSNNGELICFVRISDGELQSILRVLDE